MLNDNNMSISQNVGGVPNMLGQVRASDTYYDVKEGVANALYKLPGGEKMIRSIKNTKSNLKKLIIPDQMFESMGITYLGPVNGHDINKLIKIFNVAKRIDRAVLVHVVTHKGHGYKPAERNPSKFHGISPFDIKSGNVISSGNLKSYSDVFSDAICTLAKQDDKVAAITAAMPDGTGLKKFSKWFPDRFFDVGIAEAHAVTFSAGLAAGGIKPVFAVYSSFLQRAYDQILHDVCIQHLHVVFAIDRAGLVGSDGETHQGIFDLSFLRSIPNMTILVPKNAWELRECLRYSLQDFYGPIAIRYPRGTASYDFEEFMTPIQFGKSEIMYWESDIVLMAVGTMVSTADTVRNILKDRGYNVSLVNARFVKPVDGELIKECAGKHRLLVTLEENVTKGGFGEGVCYYANEQGIDISVLNIALPDEYVEHGSVSILKAEAGIDVDSVVSKVENAYKNILQ